MPNECRIGNKMPTLKTDLEGHDAPLPRPPAKLPNVSRVRASRSPPIVLSKKFAMLFAVMCFR